MDIRTKIIVGLSAVLIPFAVLFVRSRDARIRAEGESAAAAAMVEQLTAARVVLEARATRDSIALDSTLAAGAARDRAITAERARLAQRATQSSQEAATAQGEVRAVLDSLGASTAALDRLEAAHARELAAVAGQRDQADSATAVAKGELSKALTALASDRATHAGLTAENDALRAQVDALNRARPGWSSKVVTVLELTGTFIAGRQSVKLF